MKKTLLSLVLGLVATFSYAQTYPEISIHDLQFVSQSNLANCVDSSLYLGDTVIIVGKAIHDGSLTELASSSTNGGYRPGLWVVDTANNAAMDGFSSIQIHGVFGASNPLNPVNVLDNFTAGYIIKVVGEVTSFDGETQFQPINNQIGSIAGGDAIEIITNNSPRPLPAPVNLGDLNDASRVNQLETGEQWEGAYVELTDLTVVAVSYFSSGTRVSFDVEDANGNRINVSDRFICQKLPSWVPVNAQSPQSAGEFSVPAVGARLDTLRGIVIHSENGCTGGTGRGYELNPFDSNDYVYGPTPPNFESVYRSPLIPTSTESPVVSATIVDYDGSVTSAELFYETSGSYTSLPLNLITGSTDEYEVTIPAFADGTTVTYYIEATDNDGNVSRYPSPSTTKKYVVRDGGATIVDIQKVDDPNSDDESYYVGDTLTVTGIVTASVKANDLGYVYIQQEGEVEWAGISLVGSADLITLFRGQEVEVTGIVEENYNFTRLSVIDIDTTGNYGTIEPVVIEPSDVNLHTGANMEKYESMLVTIANADGTPMSVVEPDLGFAEYGIGNTDTSSVHQVVLAGRQNSSSFSSLFFSLISDDYYATNDGEIEVDSIVLTHPGQMIDSLTGLMHYSYSVYKLIPRNNSDIIGLADSNGVPYVIDSTVVPGPDTATGIFDLAGKTLEMKVYPNPANDIINVRIENNDEPLNLEVIDLAGRTMYNTKFNQQQVAISTESMVNGVYLVKLTDTTGNILSINKLVINK